jgi:hypothetical protein
VSSLEEMTLTKKGEGAPVARSPSREVAFSVVSVLPLGSTPWVGPRTP